MLSDLVLARITSQVTGLGTVGIAANLSAIEKVTVTFPAVFVLPAARRGSGNRYMTGVVAQKREQDVQIVTAVRNISGARGDKAITDIEQLFGLTDDAVFGWSPTADHDPLMLKEGHLLRMQNGECWWIDTYGTWFDRRA